MLRRLPVPEEVTIATSKDRPRIMLHIGELPFTVGGQPCALQVYAPKDTTDGSYWFIPFIDTTNGHETYDGGRYIDIDEVASDTVFLDFVITSYSIHYTKLYEITPPYTETLRSLHP